MKILTICFRSKFSIKLLFDSGFIKLSKGNEWNILGPRYLYNEEPTLLVHCLY
jgi:hypothetical protein